MNFNLTEEQSLIQQTMKDFVAEYVEPYGSELDQKSQHSELAFKKLSELDFMGMPFPVEYGGAGSDDLSYILALEELCKGDAGVGIAYSAHVSLSMWPIYKFGSEDLKQKYLPAMARGEKIGAFALTEPGAGTDAASGKATAVEDGDYYVVNGTKCFITNGGIASVYIVTCLTDPSLGTKGMVALVIDKDATGFEIGKHENKMGIRSSQTTELIFKNVRVHKNNILGKVGDGFKIAMQTLDGGRIGVAAQALGIAEAALQESVKFAKERVQFGKPIAKCQAIQWQLAEMATQIEAARWLVYNAANRKTEGKPYSKEAAMAKMFVSEIAIDVCNKGLQIHGGYGYIKDFKIERLYRDAKITSIYEGTNEVQRMVVSGAVLR